MTASDGKSFLGYFSTLVYEYNNSYHNSIGKKPVFSKGYIQNGQSKYL